LTTYKNRKHYTTQTMLSNKDYSKYSTDELATAQQKLQSKKISIAIIIGFVMGLAVYSATHKGGFLLTVILLMSALWIGKHHTQHLKKIEEEINRRNTPHS
jgi:heme O synthase-like polyprenyltransferase